MHCCGVNTYGRFGRSCSGHDIENIFSYALVNTYEDTSLLISELIHLYRIICDYFHLAGFDVDYTTVKCSEIQVLSMKCSSVMPRP